MKLKFYQDPLGKYAHCVTAKNKYYFKCQLTLSPKLIHLVIE